MATDRIVVKAIEFYAHHGVSDAEQQTGHRYSVDLTLQLPLQTAGTSDRLEDTASYSEAARLVVKVGTNSRYKLVETLAERIADATLQKFPSVETVIVRVTKRLPPGGVMAASAGVEIVRTRGV